MTTEISLEKSRYIFEESIMSALDRYEIGKYKQLLKDVRRLDRLDEMQELEEKIIKEIVFLVEDGSVMAKYLLAKLEQIITRRLSYSHRNKVLITALEKSLEGAFSAAKTSLN